jgi:hypothetical protein
MPVPLHACAISIPDLGSLSGEWHFTIFCRYTPPQPILVRRRDGDGGAIGFLDSISNLSSADLIYQ